MENKPRIMGDWLCRQTSMGVSQIPPAAKDHSSQVATGTHKRGYHSKLLPQIETDLESQLLVKVSYFQSNLSSFGI